MDRYACYEDLRQGERKGAHRIHIREGDRSVAIIAPHGGLIEPGTSEIADKIAGTEYTLYCFEGAKHARNFELHITSANFDEPKGASIVGRARLVIAIHGCKGDEEAVLVGGLNDKLSELVVVALRDAGFSARKSARPGFQGINPRNICNRGATGEGVQIEISRGLRRKMRSAPDAAREETAEEDVLTRLAEAIRKAITLAVSEESASAAYISSSME